MYITTAYMKTLSNPEKAFSYHLYGSGEDGLVTFVLSVPIGSLQAFIDYADHRKKIYTAPSLTRDPEYVKAGQERVERFTKSLLLFYDRFSRSGCSPSDAVSKTNKLMKEKGFCNCTHDITRKIVSAAGRFRKL